VHEMVWAKIRSSAGPLRLVVCDLSTSANIDLAGARMLAKMHADLQAAGVEFRMASAHGDARDMLRAEGLEERAGYFGRRVTALDVLDEFEARAVSSIEGALVKAQADGDHHQHEDDDRPDLRPQVG
jgi:MFS superfamily sulfate permease-like transporter